MPRLQDPDIDTCIPQHALSIGGDLIGYDYAIVLPQNE